MIRLAILRLFESYLRHRWLYLLPIVGALGAAVATILLSPQQYRTSGVIYVQLESYLSELTSVRDQGFTWQTPSSLTSNQFNELLRTDAFVRAIIQQTDLEAQMDDGDAAVRATIAEVRDSIWTRPVGETHLEINVSHRRPLISYQLAEAAIASFTQWQINIDRTQSVAAEGFFDELIASYDSDLERARQALEDYLVAHPEPIRGDRPITEALQIQRLEQDVDLAQSRYSGALSKEEDARLATAQAESDVRQRISLIDAPRIPTGPERGLRDIALDVGVFGVVGVLITATMIVAAALLDRTLRYPLDVRQLLQLDVLATVPNGRVEPAEAVTEPVATRDEQPWTEREAESSPAQPSAAD